MNKKIINKLIEEAKKVRNYAYAPYSNFAVGAAVLCAMPLASIACASVAKANGQLAVEQEQTEDERIFAGCNVENVALGLSICAERCAIAKAFSEGYREIRAIAIVTDTENPSAPCGICRQVFHEFNPKMKIILSNLSDKILIKEVKDLLPFAFERNR